MFKYILLSLTLVSSIGLNACNTGCFSWARRRPVPAPIAPETPSNFGLDTGRDAEFGSPAPQAPSVTVATSPSEHAIIAGRIAALTRNRDVLIEQADRERDAAEAEARFVLKTAGGIYSQDTVRDLLRQRKVIASVSTEAAIRHNHLMDRVYILQSQIDLLQEQIAKV